MQKSPDVLASVVLDGLYPPEQGVTFGRDVAVLRLIGDGAINKTAGNGPQG